MKKFVFVGDVCRPGRVLVEAESAEEAIEKISNDPGAFSEVLDTDDHDLAHFEWTGETDTVEEW